ncbi:MAG: hypothetical protein N4J56_000713 [Chroococcidiopsis sp. SAG 2025]|uniref:GNAT family N-acetyltransferase n=1 Tax=Chroococcidiopsis sp. SAG 2025 TaxID=171389 RepID=UPI0029372698|nr:GNAT family N-acetyltransferase [Chroococcidiopsis sp. SAG 2025]MDV2991059.1 hypothetical protein [Chroococcidiopsis sp. SAG 2025]
MCNSLSLKQATAFQLKILLNRSENTIDNLTIPDDEEVAPQFLLEDAIEKLNHDCDNAFWLLPRLIIVGNAIVGTVSFKSLPEDEGSVEIGYGIISSQQRRGFVTKAVELFLKEALSTNKIQTVIAHTDLSNKASCRVLEKNGFIKVGSYIDPDDGEVWMWQKKISATD